MRGVVWSVCNSMYSVIIWVRGRAYSQTRKFQKALDYLMSRSLYIWIYRISTRPFHDVCKYRSAMINCSCQDTRHFARARLFKLVLRENGISHIILLTVKSFTTSTHRHSPRLDILFYQNKKKKRFSNNLLLSANIKFLVIDPRLIIYF